ncbi:MAG TPA: hypothetical protein PK675_04385 [Clostridia bacterium]|nr:hypothetical protein [Clostridia bacterium]
MPRNLISYRTDVDGGTKKTESITITDKTDTKAYADLTKNLKDIDTLYSVNYTEPKLDLPVSTGAVKIEYEMPEQDELYSQAKTNLAEKYYTKADQIRSDNVSDSNSISDKIDQAELKAMFEIRELNENENEDKQNIRKNALERGVARSSIVESAENDAEQRYSKEKSSITEQKEANVNLLKQNLEKLKNLSTEALASLGISQDLETQELAQKLYNEALEKQEEIAKYNNTISSNEAKLQASNEKLRQEAMTNEYQRAAEAQKLLAEVGEAGLEKIVRREKYYAVITYLDNLTKEQAIDLLEKRTDLQDELGSFYEWVVEYVENKK